MGRNKRERAAKKEEARRRQNRNLGLGIAGLTAAVIGIVGGTIICSPARTNGKPVSKKKVVQVSSGWGDHYYADGVPIDVIAGHSPSYMELSRKSKTTPFNPRAELIALHKSVDFSDYDTFAMGAKYKIFIKELRGINEVYSEIFLKQNGFQQAADYALANVPGKGSEQAQDMLLNIAFYLNRSTRRAAKGLEVTSLVGDSWRQDLKDGKADCKAHSAYTLFNFYSFAKRLERIGLVGNVRVVGGFSPNTQESGRSHVWLEALVDGEWRIIECNSPQHNNLLGTGFDPNRNYWESALQDPTVSKGYKRLVGFVYSSQAKEYVGSVLTLPQKLDEEMRMHGWKP